MTHELRRAWLTSVQKNALVRDLSTFLPGLSPVLSFASLSIRPLFLHLLETHIVHLKSIALRPALRALLLCLLPGLEEENGEDFDRTLKIVDRIRDAVDTHSDGSEVRLGDEYFWQCLFLCTISSSSRRQGVLAFLVRRLPKLCSTRSSISQSTDNVDGYSQNEDIDGTHLPPSAEPVVSPEPGLLIRCFAAGLEDNQPLLQRGFLDLLLTHLPLDSPVFTHRVGDQDLERLVLAATAVVARRDMSLNRRLWSWFLGPYHHDEDNDIISPSSPILKERKDDRGLLYFQKFGLKPLSSSILSMLSQTKIPLAERVRPYRIALSLMDRWEIGSSLVPQIFIPAISSLRKFQQYASKAEYQEVLRSASGFFDGTESGMIWAEITRLVESALTREPTAKETRHNKLGLASFVLESFHVQDEEMIAFHVPLSCAFTLALLLDREASQDLGLLSGDEETLEIAMSLVEQLVGLMPERAQLNSSFGQNNSIQMHNGKGKNGAEKQVIRLISSFYVDHSGDLSSSPPPFSSSNITHLLLNTSCQTLVNAIKTPSTFESLSLRARVFSLLTAKTPDCTGPDLEDLSSRLLEALQQQRTSPDTFTIAAHITKIAVNLLTKCSRGQQRLLKSKRLIPTLVETFWSFLSPSTPKFHVEGVRNLWQLDTADTSDGILESSVSRFISNGQNQNDSDGNAEAARRFAILWTHSMNLAAGIQKRGSVARRTSLIGVNNLAIEARDHQSILIRPLLLALEGLNSEGSELYFFLVSWLKSSGILFTVFDVILIKLSALEHCQKQNASLTRKSECHRLKLCHNDKTKECCYFLRQIANLLRLPLENINVVLAAQGNADNSTEVNGDSLYEAGINVCLDMIEVGFNRSEWTSASTCSEMQCLALSVLQQFLALTDHGDFELPILEQKLLDMLARCTQVEQTAPSVQVALLDTTMSYLKAKFTTGTVRRLPHHRKVSSVDASSASARRSSTEWNDRKPISDRSPPPEQLLKRLQAGIISPNSRIVLENWVGFLVEVLPLYSHSLFQNLIPIVGTFCQQISSSFEQIRNTFGIAGESVMVMPETSLMSLLNGLEHTLAIAHDRLAVEETSTANIKPPETPQGFFGNVVSGVFNSEQPKGRSSAANSKLTVTLCLQDAVRICFSIWSWAVYGHEDEQFDSASAASFSYSSSRLRNRARRLLDRMFIAETLECLETLIAQRDLTSSLNVNRSSTDTVISLLHTLDGSRPKRLMPALFNSLYSRTNPSALEPNKMSSLTSEVKDTSIGVFLVDYSKSLDDDAMYEIWADCMTFLKDVLSNPLVHSSILPCLLLFVLTLAEKVEKTNFGEQRRMRKDLSELFQRLLAAIFTSRPSSIINDPSDGTGSIQGPGIVDTLTTILPRLHVIVQENDRQLNIVTNISRNIFEPVLHSKSFPENLAQSYVDLLLKIARISSSTKVWRKDVAEIYNHARLFSCKFDLVRTGLLPLLRQWGLAEKDRFSDTLTRIPTPTQAGIVFGVGASAARLDADKKAQLNLRRAALLAVALETDALVPNMNTLLEKITELLNATAASSPSSVSRAEISMLIQAVVLKTSSVHLTSLWPIITAELQKALASVMPNAKDHETYNAFSLLQACKLLDLLLLLGPDDFQMHAWLFITDTIDAVYRPPDGATVGLVDELGDEFSAGSVAQSPGPGMTPATPEFSTLAPGTGAESNTGAESKKRLLLNVKSSSVVDMSKEELVRKILRPWFAQLSLQCFEREYSMGAVDWEGCRAGLLEELFEEQTMVG